MKSRDIKFANEFCFNVKCESPVIELKEHNTYEYQIAAESLMIGNDGGFSAVEILKAKSEVLSKLAEYNGRSLLRLDKVNEDANVYTFTLLCFYQHMIFEEPYQVLIDDAIYPELRRRRLDLNNIGKLFTDDLVLDGKYWFAYGSDNKNTEQRLYGKKYSIVVAPSTQGYLHITAIYENKNRSRAENLITLMSGSIEFKDNTENLRRVSAEFMDKFKQATRNNSDLIKLWSIYDHLGQEAIKKDATDMGVLQYKNYRRSRGNLVFSIIGGYVLPEFLRGDMQYAVIPEEAFNEDEPLNYNPRSAVIIGSEFDKSCVGSTEFVISDEQIDAFKNIPQRGYIVPSINGSVIQSKRRKIAQTRILNGENPLLGLNLLLQSGECVGVSGKERTAVTESLRKYIFGEDKEKKFNDRQREAIRIAINTPDIAVIQGPPGTGKTQVIKAIIERINELEDGNARILISSTQHDAVDNAIKGVSYGGVPVNRVFNRERATVEDTPVFGWIDEMIASCGDWLHSHQTESDTQEIFRCIKNIRSGNPSEIEGELKILYHLLQTNDYSGDLLAQINETIVGLIDLSKPTFDANSNSRLGELLRQQRTDVSSFLIDGVQNLKPLEMYLKWDCEDITFEIPAYWKQLKRATADTPRLDELLTMFKQDIAFLQKECNAEQTPEIDSTISSKLETLLLTVEEEMAARGESKTHEEMLFDCIWQFKHDLSNIQNVKSLISSYSQVNAATCQQAANKFISPAMKGFEDTYDYVIIDEAARSNPLDLLIPMSMGRKIILVGDHKQLPHMVEKDIVEAVVQKTKDVGANAVLEESLFMRLFNKVKEADEQAKADPTKPGHIGRTCTLNQQFRMHSQICELINVFYAEEQLETACKDSDKEHNLGLYNNKPLVWIDVPASGKTPMETKGISKSRPCEVSVIKKELSKILTANTKFEIGIITFYSKQAELLKNMIDEEFPSDAHRISVGTVDAFQGKEFDVVILSAVRSNTETEMNKRVGFLNNNNRLCVAFSRAKRLLITVGDSKTVAHDGSNVIIEPLNELLKRSKQEDIGYYETL